MTVQISYKAWLIGRDRDASKNILVATRILVFDLELFIGPLREKERVTSKDDLRSEVAGQYTVYW